VSIWKTVNFTRTTLLREINKKVTKYRVNVLKELRVAQTRKFSRPSCNSKVLCCFYN
jgi:hypothetical protein